MTADFQDAFVALAGFLVAFDKAVTVEMENESPNQEILQNLLKGLTELIRWMRNLCVRNEAIQTRLQEAGCIDTVR